MFKTVSDVVFVLRSARGFCRTHIFQKCDIYIFCHFSIAIVVACRRALVLDTDHQAFAYCHGCRDGFSVSSTAQHRSIESKQLTRTGSGSEHRQQIEPARPSNYCRWCAQTAGSNLRVQAAAKITVRAASPDRGIERNTAQRHSTQTDSSWAHRDFRTFTYSYIYIYIYI